MITIKKKIVHIICHRIENLNDSKEREEEKKKYLHTFEILKEAKEFDI